MVSNSTQQRVAWSVSTERTDAHLPTERTGRPRLGPDDTRQLRRLFSYVRPYAPRLAWGMAAVAIASLLALAFPLLIRDLLNSAFAPGTRPGEARAVLDRTAALLFLLMLLQAGFNYVRTYQLGRVGESVVADLRKQLYAHLLTLPVGFFEKRKTGEITSRLTSDVATVQSAVSQSLAQLVNQSISLVGGLIVLFVLEARLTLVMLTVVPAVVLVAAFFGRRLRRVSTDFQDLVAAANADADEAIQGIRVVKSFTAEELEARRYAGSIDASFARAVHRVRLRSFFVPSVILFGFAGMGVVLWYGGRLAISGDLGSGDLVGFLLITLFVAGSIGSFTGLWAQLQEAIGASRRIFQLLDERPEQAQPSRPLRPSGASGRVAYEGVSFSYPDRAANVLSDVSLQAEPGQVVALVGPSGAGKSTLVSLLPRFYDPQRGRVLLDGVDVRQFGLRDLRRHIGLVPQETQLFSGSVADNIRFGWPAASQHEVRAAALSANAAQFIEALPDGYATKVGERGVKLSGGQRQRLAIARALLKDPRILILDEATSSLDSESEALVQAALEVLMRGRTTFVIAHRLSTVIRADQTLVLEGGRIVQRGTHAQLLATPGLYQNLYRQQFAAQIE